MTKHDPKADFWQFNKRGRARLGWWDAGVFCEVAGPLTVEDAAREKDITELAAELAA